MGTPAATPLPAGAAAGDGRVRVVLIDDHAPLRALLRLSLETDGGFDVVGDAGDGAEGIVLVERERPDLVLLDLSMPRMDGLEALKRIRRLHPGGHVVILTGFSSARLHELVRRLGASGYIEKGIDTDRLVPFLHNVVANAAPPLRDFDEALARRARQLSG